MMLSLTLLLSLLPAQTFVLTGPAGPAGVQGLPGMIGGVGPSALPLGNVCTSPLLLVDATTCSLRSGAIPSIERSVLINVGSYFPIRDSNSRTVSWNANSGAITRSDNSAMTSELRASVPLPAGAVPTRITCYVLDATGSLSKLLFGLQVNDSATSSANCGAAETTKGSGIRAFTAASTCNDPVDEDLLSPSFHAYSIRIQQTATDPTIAFHGCKVSYTITQLGN